MVRKGRFALSIIDGGGAEKTATKYSAPEFEIHSVKLPTCETKFKKILGPSMSVYAFNPNTQKVEACRC